MRIRRATLVDLDQFAHLFNQYIVFYNQPSDLEGCKHFLRQRMIDKDAIIFIAESSDNEALGFTLLYPSFSSVRRAKIYVLNDLYVAENNRRMGVGTALINYAVNFGRQDGAYGLHLETDTTNNAAQKLYEELGWIKEEHTYHYNYTF